MAKFITQHRRGTTADWKNSAVIPAVGEIIIEECSNGQKKFKIGDGVSRFSDLRYVDEEIEAKIDLANQQISQLISLPEGATSDDAELQNIRIPLNGEPFATAGDAVRAIEQDVTNLRDELQQFIGAEAVDGLHYEDNMLQLTAGGKPVGDPIEVIGGVSGGDGTVTVGYVVRVSTSMPATKFATATGSTTILTAAFSEKFGGESTGGSGQLVVLYRASTSDPWATWDKENKTVDQSNEFSVDVTELLEQGHLYIRLEVTGNESQITKYITFEITPVDVNFDTNFDTTMTYTGRVPVTCSFQGKNVEKILCVEIDGILVDQIAVGTLHNDTYPYTVDVTSYSYGAHDLVMYFVTPEGAKSNIKTYTLLYDNGLSTAPLIGVIQAQKTVTYGSPYQLQLVLDTPTTETTSVNIEVYTITGEEKVVYHTQQLSNISNNTLTPWTCSNYPQEGVAFIKFTSGTTTKTIQFTVKPYVNEQGYITTPVSSDLVYHYSAVGKTNNDLEKETYTYPYEDSTGTVTRIKALNEGFNWVSNGYVQTAEDGTALRFSGDACQTIKLPIFSTSYVDDDGQSVRLEAASDATVTTRGRTIEFEYKVSNVTDPQAQIIKCMSSEHAGFVITPQTCYLLSSDGVDVDIDPSGFIENEDVIPAAYLKEDRRLRVSFVIEARGTITYEDKGQTITAQCVNIYVNGEYANSVPYTTNATFGQSEFITLGDSSCILDLYDVKIYNTALKTSEILRNYNTSQPELNDRLTRIIDNDVLDVDGNVDYELARKKYACLLATGPLAPYKLEDSKYNSGWTLTLPANNEAGFVTEFNLLDKDDSGKYVSQNNVQGTSSVKFPVKNYKVYLRKRTNNEDGTFKEAKKVKYSLKGKDTQGNPLSIEESTLCWKGDFMSSDHANTFNANMADKLFEDTLDSQNPEKGGDARVQNTIYGFRCLLFQRDDESSVPVFAGDGALNNDKGNTKTFGLEHDDDIIENNDDKSLTMPVSLKQKWEFKNNTEAICSFHSDRFFQTDKDGNKIVKAALESCYPDQGDLEEEGMEPDYRPLQTFYTWVCQRANFITASTDKLDVPIEYNGVSYDNMRDYRKAIFIREFDRHMNRHHAIIYYLFIEFTALADNMAKNMFLRSEDVLREKLVNTSGQEMSIMDAITPVTGEVNADMIDWENSEFAIWITDLYDLDSCYGVENTGKLLIPYYADWWHEVDNIQLFNGRDSHFWMMIQEAFADDIKTTAQRLTEKAATEGGLNYDALYHYHIENNAELVCPAVVNRDMDYKYNDSWKNGYIDYQDATRPLIRSSMYKYLQRGSRTEQKDNFIYKRSNLLYSKYLCPKFINQTACISFRCGKEGGVVARDSGITITASQVIYPAVKFGDGDAAIVQGERTFEGVPVTITKPGLADTDRVGNSDTVYIGGGILITDIGDVSKFHPDELRLEKATGLKRLILGSTADGYTNAKLTSVNAGPCKLLEEINIAGCTAVSDLDLSQNGLIKKVVATNTNCSVTLPNGGVLEELLLGNVAKLEILNQSKLNTFVCGYNNLKSLRIENTPVVPVKDILMQYHSALINGVRLVGINVSIDSDDFLKLLLDDSMRGKYINDKGIFIQGDNSYPYISGTVRIDKLDATLLKQLNEAYPDLEIVYNTLYCTVTFMGVSEEPIVQEINYVTDSTLEGYGENNAECPILSEDEKYADIVAPTMEPTAQYTFTWGGWARTENSLPEENILIDVQSNLVLYPAFNRTINQYTVTFWNPSPDKNIQVHEVTVDYGTKVEYSGTHLSKLETDAPSIYEWTGWNPAPDSVVADMDCYAVFNLIDSKWYTLNPFDITHTVEGDRIDIETCENKSNLMVRIPSVFEVEGKTYKTRALEGFGSASFKFVDIQENAETLEPYCFSNNSRLVEVYMPDSLQAIKANAFNMCHQLERVTIPKNVDSIAQGAFSQSTNIKELYVDPENTTYTVTDNCLIDKVNKLLIVGLNDSTIPTDGSVTTIGEEAFRGTAKEEIILPPVVDGNNVLLGSMCFADCQNLTEIVIPEGYTELVATVFAWSLKLSKVTLPNSLTKIGTYVFAQCPIEEITFPAGLTKIGDHSFANNPNLRKVVFKGTVKELHEGVFADSGIAEPWEIHVPWSEGDVAGAPWGANENCTIVYNSIS